MTTLAICCTLYGVALGVRFRFFVLVPMLLLGALLVIMLSFARELTFGQALTIAALFAGCLQFGYLISALFRHMVGPTMVIDRKEPLPVRSSAERRI
ncbi:hypothetical protein MTX26_22985 [Bradyrhizobium sp. ISRA443]|uniref:hypothetical protein n=1 Tax=unclassified Bradyrhizobium TaxID=2631580 RepID=UPI00247AB914|nr:MULTISPECIES: hypothetical protein [unclassified Bradyrhizobium]WGR92821.1 hypothetical protein MTX20_33825 [Bradyrhizobium sp. ISRA435]WGR97289.1 hypothetical protein MTX23_22985 [Bradyrhizobium sp. ISRA436]WGS04178.1 hypothetical protein MTX18_22985 [Bradyrhizobium sp. ISRA437]WGS11061.1 hypothetical protein MTX26_22985 [Bradyrhizobium sp. ISRA443]